MALAAMVVLLSLTFCTALLQKIARSPDLPHRITALLASGSHPVWNALVDKQAMTQPASSQITSSMTPPRFLPSTYPRRDLSIVAAPYLILWIACSQPVSW